MKTIARGLVQTILIVGGIVNCGVAQESPEKHVRDIRAEQTQDVILMSALCKKSKAAHLPKPQFYAHLRDVNPTTLEKDLPALMQKSDEVVLVGRVNGETMAISPSGEDAIMYLDGKVLRTWKGSHRVGDLITVGFPDGSVKCGPDKYDTPSTLTGRDDRLFAAGTYMDEGPLVLFVRHDVTGLVDGFRLTGGDGTQGMFVVKPARHSEIINERSKLNACFRASVSCDGPGVRDRYPECRDPHIEGGMIAKCNAAANVSQKAVTIGYGRDLLIEKCDGMPISKFLKKVQAVADSLGYTGPAESAK